jgi:DNA-binding MarR family transcriptional regulator
MHADRPQAPGYLANLMARLFHEVSGKGLEPLGIRPEHFPILVELWFGDGDVSRASLEQSQEADAATVDIWVRAMAADGVIEAVPADRTQKLVLTAKASAARDDAVKAARRANQAATGVLSEAELAQFMDMMNRVIDALQAAKAAS